MSPLHFPDRPVLRRFGIVLILACSLGFPLISLGSPVLAARASLFVPGIPLSFEELVPSVTSPKTFSVYAGGGHSASMEAVVMAPNLAGYLQARGLLK